MRKSIVLLFALSMLCFCSSVEKYRKSYRAELRGEHIPKYKVFVYRHPDYHFTATDPNSITIYDEFEPVKQYFVMGRISVNDTEGFNQLKEEKEIERMAAAIGGEAVMIVETYIDSKEFGSEKKVGLLIPQEDWMAYVEWKRENKIEVTVRRRFGYVIRWE